MECHSVTREEDTLPFATAWMDAEGAVLSEISQKEKGLSWLLLTWGIQKSQTHKNRLEWWFPRDGGLGRSWSEVQTVSGKF